MVAALRLSKRWEMWEMSSPREPRRTDLYEETGQGGKSRIRTPRKLHKILESIFYPKLPIYCRDPVRWLFYTFPQRCIIWNNRHNTAFGSMQVPIKAELK